ncbi:MAG: MarR family transcriptional regulator [Nocardiopsaceae bacterium]|jgi:DNA-binding MarR family transcriptional regulator|nr:MarR family transcriptional regulator [Nocardiopsaceae bacterium]
MTTVAGPLGMLDPRLADHTGHLARLVAVRAEACLQASLPAGRGLRDLAVLAVLAESPSSQAQLGTLLHVNRTVMISVIDGIEAAGLVRRERDPADRRRYALRITEEGTAALPELNAAATRADRSLTAPLHHEQHRRLIGLLRRVVPGEAQALPGTLTSLAVFLIGQVSQQLRARSERALRGRGIKPRCVRMLVALDAAQPCTQERLARAMSLAPPTIVSALDELRADGLMLSARNPDDRREHVLRLSEDGKHYLADALLAERAAQHQLAEMLGTGETGELNALLTALLR